MKRIASEREHLYMSVEQRTFSQEDQECIFQPELSPVSEIIIAAKKEWEAEESASERAHRLSAVDAQRQAAARARQEQQYYGQFTFRPTINPQSHRMAQVGLGFKTRSHDALLDQVDYKRCFVYAMLCYAMLCYAMLCYAMLCYAMLCYAMLCYAMLCYAMLCVYLVTWFPGQTAIS